MRLAEKGSEMILKRLRCERFHCTRLVRALLRLVLPTRGMGIDVRSLKLTEPMTEAEKVERYRAGCFAEMTDIQAGI